MQTTPKCLGIPPVLVGCLLLLVAAASAWSTRSFVRRATRATGVVVALNAGSAHPEIEFDLPSGEKVSFPAGGFISYSVGERPTVLYLPEAPFKGARLDHFGALWMRHIMLAAMGLIALAFGVRGLLAT